MADPLIIEAALNGPNDKTFNPNVPIGTEEVVASALACLDAGAAVVHHHGEEGLMHPRHSADPYRDVWRSVRDARPDAILYPTMGGGGAHTNIVERYAHIEELAADGLLELSIVDPGSVNLGPLRPNGVPHAIELVYINTYADVEHMFARCVELDVAVHVSVFDPSFLATALAWHRAGKTPPLKIQLYFGGEGYAFGLPPTVKALEAYLEMLDGTDIPWMAGVIGGDCGATLAREAIRRGGHVRVGLEDYFGDRTPRNEDLVAEVVEIAREEDREVAIPAQAAAILGLR